MHLLFPRMLMMMMRMDGVSYVMEGTFTIPSRSIKNPDITFRYLAGYANHYLTKQTKNTVCVQNTGSRTSSNKFVLGFSPKVDGEHFGFRSWQQ